MKKLLSVFLILTLVLGLLAGCSNDSTSGSSSTVSDAKTYLESIYKDDNGRSYSVDFTRVQAVRIGSDSYSVSWAVEGGDGLVSIETGDTMSTIVVDKNYGDDVVTFTLVATISDGNGNTETLTYTHSIPTSTKIDTESYQVLYFNQDCQYVTAEGYTYTSSSGSTKEELVLSTNREDGMSFKCEDHEDYVCFVTDDGKYLYADGTNVQWVDGDDTENGYTHFVIEAADGGVYIKCATATYGGNAQYLEVYSGYLTCYSFSDSKSYLYVFTLLGENDAAHVHTEVTVAGYEATCTTDGLTAGVQCSECGAWLTAQTTIAAGHTWGEWEVTTEPADGVDGEATRTCSVCGETETKVVSAEGQDPMLDILDAAYALEGGASLEGTQTLTGEIISIDTAYSADYGNITVTIVVCGDTDRPIQCFRLKGDGAENLAVGDTITVTGTIKNYVNSEGVSKIEFDSGCTLVTESEDAATSYILYCVGSSVYVTGTEYLYNDYKYELVTSESADDALVLTMVTDGDYVSFITADGKYLMADGTNVQLVSEANENTNFVLETVDGGYLIKCAVATYNNNPQYLEVYYGYLTVYGYNESNIGIYTFTLIEK